MVPKKDATTSLSITSYSDFCNTYKIIGSYGIKDRVRLTRYRIVEGHNFADLFAIQVHTAVKSVFFTSV
jgi:hypothetical protein